MISNSKVKKRPRNFCGANVDTLGLFQMESVSDANEIKGNVLAMIIFTDFKITYNWIQLTSRSNFD